MTTVAAPPLPKRAARAVSLLRVFSVFLAVYLLTWACHYTSGDGGAKLAWTHALLTNASVDIDPAPGVQVSKYGIGHSLVAAVPVAVAWGIERTIGMRTEVVLYTLLFVVNGAALLMLIAAYARRHYDADRVWMLVLTIGLATTWWPHTKLDFTEPLVATCLFSGFLLVRSGRSTLGAAVGGFCGLLRPDAFLLAAWLVAWAIRSERLSRRQMVTAGLAVMAAVAAHLATNVWRYGTLTAGYPGESFSTPVLVGLWGLLLSPGKSVFLYSPPLILGLAGLRRFAAASKAQSRDAWFFAGVLAIQVLLYCRWWDWSGDDAWGPRFLLPGAILATIPAIALFDRLTATRVLVGAGIAVQLCGVLVSPLDYLMMVRSTEAQRPVVFGSGTNRVDLDDVRFNPSYSPIAGHVLLIRHLVGSAPDRGVATTEAGVYEAFPQSAWHRAAQWDPLSIRLLGCLWSRGPAASLRACIAR
jgi:uncharacterized membrane protein YhaH (DUF805 family)